MLELRANCEICNKDLPANSLDARICSYECTFCRICANSILENVCPNCSGNLVPRPIRPHTARRDGISLEHQPAAIDRVKSKYTEKEIRKFSDKVKNIRPELR